MKTLEIWIRYFLHDCRVPDKAFLPEISLEHEKNHGVSNHYEHVY